MKWATLATSSTSEKNDELHTIVLYQLGHKIIDFKDAHIYGCLKKKHSKSA